MTDQSDWDWTRHLRPSEKWWLGFCIGWGQKEIKRLLCSLFPCPPKILSMESEAAALWTQITFRLSELEIYFQEPGQGGVL